MKEKERKQNKPRAPQIEEGSYMQLTSIQNKNKILIQMGFTEKGKINK